jgi:hypothetical protein
MSAGLLRTLSGHQNHLPSKAVIDGVINERTISVSKSRPRPIVVPPWPIDVKSLKANEAIVTAKTRPAAVTTPPVASDFLETCRPRTCDLRGRRRRPAAAQP